jgi:hypothetical protein
MHDNKRIYKDMKALDRQSGDPNAKGGTAEKIAPKSDSEGAENGSVEPRPLIATPPMARRGE